MLHSGIRVREAAPADIHALGSVVFDAFASIADRHNFPRDFQSAGHGAHLIQMLVEHPGFWGVVAEVDGRVVACNFLDQRDDIGGVGPITVNPEYHGRGIGRALMEQVIDRARGMRGMRLVQDAFNMTSLSLYAGLGFDAVEPLALMAGVPRDAKPDSAARLLVEADIEEVCSLCREVHGISRRNEVRDAIKQIKPYVLERDGRIAAYCTAPEVWLMNHGVARSEQDLRTLLLAAAAACGGPIALLVPTRRGEFFRWCLEQGLRMTKPMCLMSRGRYQEPAGAFYPSVIY
jgi:GNAT superfamily N-acetyltransferase